MQTKLLILDLDETLVFATETPLAHPPDFRVAHYSVYLRPGVGPFLAWCRQHFQVAVWTSSTEGYASAIVTRLFGADYPLVFLWGRRRCTQRFHPETLDYHWIKNLRKVKRRGWALEHVIMVDDTPAKLALNYGNLVRIVPFEGDRADRQLELLQRYLTRLKEVANVRRVEKRGWYLSNPQP